MKTCFKMQQIITEIANQHSLDLSAPMACLRLEHELFQPLVIEKSRPNQISVAHYREQNGDLLPDPEIVFFTSESGWYPIEITQVSGGWKLIGVLNKDASRIVRARPKQMEEVAQFAEMWADNIREQGWLEVPSQCQVQETA